MRLSNGSEVRSVPVSGSQIRGWSTDLLIVYEAAFLDEELLHGAAMPTVAARPDARVVPASSPWSDSGPFWSAAMAGTPPSEFTWTVRWALRDTPWITPAAIEAARTQMSELRFRAEFLGEFVGSADAYFPADLLRGAAAEYERLEPDAAGGRTAYAGLDRGRSYDAHALVLVAPLEDHGTNPVPQEFLPYWDTSRRPYLKQVELVAGLHSSTGGRYRLATVTSETNGVGAYPSEDLARRLVGRVIPVASTQGSKEDAYGRVLVLLQRRQLILPADPKLLRHLGGIVARPTERGGITIGAAQPSVHDDLPNALTLPVSGMPGYLLDPARLVTPETAPAGVTWTVTGDGRRLPSRPRPRGLAASCGELRAVTWDEADRDSFDLAAVPYFDGGWLSAPAPHLERAARSTGWPL